MKDLKHYFGSPSEEKKEQTSDKTNGPKEKKLKSNNSTPENVEPAKTKKKKKKKRKRSISSVEDEDSVVDVEVEEEKIKVKKRRESLGTPKAVLLQPIAEEGSGKKSTKKKKKLSDSSKENSISNGCNVEEDGDNKLDVSPLEPSNNLLNYFNKVDKLPPLKPKSNKIVVEAMVHSSPEGPDLVQMRQTLKTKLRIRRSPGKEPVYNVIHDMEEICVIEEETLIPETPLLNEDTAVIILEDGKNFSTPVCRPKLEQSQRGAKGTLQYFFKSSFPQPLKEEESPVHKERKAAVKLFLQSGTPDVKEFNKPKKRVEGIPAPYPKVSHVRQKDPMNIIWSLPKVNDRVPWIPESHFSSELPLWNWVIDKTCGAISKNDDSEEKNKPLNQKHALKVLKKECKQHPVTAWYRELSKQKKSSVSEMWSERYKPDNSTQLLGNQSNVAKLKNWLQTCTELRKKQELIVDSSDEFVNSDDEKCKSVKNVALLSGPVGTGKTATVFAIASELGYEVLELNASCNRSGKKIVKDFAEALQSHNACAISLGVFQKKKETKEKKRTLILIEDADLLFINHDEGFSATIINLAMNSKRPVVFVTNETESKHLSKLKPHFVMELKFSAIKQSILGTWLKAVSISEKLVIPDGHMENLTYLNKSDVRKCLLQLQLSGEESTTLPVSNEFKIKNFWTVLGNCNLSKNLVKETARLTNVISTSDILTSSLSENCEDDLIPQPWSLELRSSTSLDHLETCEDQLGKEMVDHLCYVLYRLTDNELTSSNQKLLTSASNKLFNVAAEDLLDESTLLSKVSICTDYLPTLRQIARLEKIRLETQSKRTNRFSNYLNVLGLKRNSDKLIDSMCTSLVSQTNLL